VRVDEAEGFTMQEFRWWTPDTIFVAGIGMVMAVIFGAAMFLQPGSTSGSDLVPAATLQKLRDQEARCQTITDDQAVTPGSRSHC
jgi:hypothetical protein